MRKTSLTQSRAPDRVIGRTKLANSTWILLKLSMFYQIPLLIILLVIIGVEPLLCLAVNFSSTLYGES